MTLHEARTAARVASLNGYVQHVNMFDNGVYYISDWYGDCTVCSFENGREL